MKTLNRSRLNCKLRSLYNYPVAIASTPNGYGKTTALRSYLDGQNATKVWFSMYEQDDELWAWKKITTKLSDQLNNVEIAANIPASRYAIDHFLEDLSAYMDKPLFIILDDVKIDEMPKIMKFLSVYSYVPTSMLHFIIITRDNMGTAVLSGFSNDVLLLTSSDFAFTEIETRHLCHLEQISLSAEEITFLHNSTNGWTIAVVLMIESYKSNRNFNYTGDINTLIHHVVFDHLETEIQQDFSRLSTLKHFTLDFAHKICKTPQTIKKLIKLETENHLIQMVDHQTYQFIPIFNEFLSKELIASPVNVKDLISDIGNSYLAEKEPLDGIEFFLKINDYESIVQVLNQYSDVSFSDIAPQLMIEVFEQLPDHFKNSYPYVYLKWITDVITNFPQIDGVSLLEDFKNRIELGLMKEDQQQLLGEYYFIHGFLHFNDMQQMMEDFKTAHKYFDGGYSRFTYSTMITSFGSCHMLFLYYNQLGTLKETVNYVDDNIQYFIDISNGNHSGSNNLVKAEYLFETGDYEQVQLYATLAYQEAMEKNQLSVAICSLFLKGRLMLIENKGVEFSQVTQQLIDFYNKTNIPILRYEIDCALGYLYILNNESQKVEDWLKTGAFEDVYLLPEASLYPYIVHGLYLAKEHNTTELKCIIEMIKEKGKDTTFVLADIYVEIFQCILNFQLGKPQDALSNLNNSINLSAHDCVQTPLIELSFAFSYLIEMYIPTTFFEEKVIEVAKKHLEDKMDTPIPPSVLTPKEKEVLELYVKGNKTKDIAAMKHISVNTVQSHMKAIYKKLKISSKLAAAEYYNKNFKA